MPPPACLLDLGRAADQVPDEVPPSVLAELARIIAGAWGEVGDPPAMTLPRGPGCPNDVSPHPATGPRGKGGSMPTGAKTTTIATTARVATRRKAGWRPARALPGRTPTSTLPTSPVTLCDRCVGGVDGWSAAGRRVAPGAQGWPQ